MEVAEVIRHCFMCGEQRAEELFPFRAQVLPTTPVVFLCSQECDILFRTAEDETVTNSRCQLIEAFRIWLDEYAMHGADCPLPNEFFEERYPELFGTYDENGPYWGAIERGFITAYGDNVEDVQGYHDEFEEAIHAAIKDLT